MKSKLGWIRFLLYGFCLVFLSENKSMGSCQEIVGDEDYCRAFYSYSTTRCDQGYGEDRVSQICNIIDINFKNTSCDQVSNREYFPICQAVASGMKGDQCGEKPKLGASSETKSVIRFYPCMFGKFLQSAKSILPNQCEINPSKYPMASLDSIAAVVERIQVPLTLDAQLRPAFEKHLRDFTKEDSYAFYRSLETLVNLIESEKDNWFETMGEAHTFTVPSTLQFNGKVQPVEIWLSGGEIYLNFKKVLLGSGGEKDVMLGVHYEDGMGKKSYGLRANALYRNLETDEDFQKSRNEFDLLTRFSERAGTLPPVELYPKNNDGLMENILVHEYFGSGDLMNFREFFTGRRSNPYFKDSRSVEKARIEAAVDLLGQLAWLHENGISHGDIKGDNIFVRDGETKSPKMILSDFGSGKKLSNYKPTDRELEYQTQNEGEHGGGAKNATFKLMSAYVGTAVFSSPEVRQSRENPQYNQEKYLKTSDAWAMGLVLHSLRTGVEQEACLPDNTNPVSAYKQIMKITSYDKLCEICGIFCSEGSKTQTHPPKQGTYEAVVYQLLNPDPDKRLAPKEAEKQMTALLEQQQ